MWWLFKFAISMFVLTLIMLIIIAIGIDITNDAKTADKYRGWVRKLGIITGLFLWLSIVGIIWH